MAKNTQQLLKKTHSELDAENKQNVQEKAAKMQEWGQEDKI